MKLTCRTCLSHIESGSLYYPLILEKSNGCKDANIQKMLEACVPELTLDIAKDAILCSQCAKELRISYNFRKKCVETEDYVYRYMVQTDINNSCVDVSQVANWLSQQGMKGNDDSGLPDIISITDDEDDDVMLIDEGPISESIVIDEDPISESIVIDEVIIPNKLAAPAQLNENPSQPSAKERTAEEHPAIDSNPLLTNALTQPKVMANVTTNKRTLIVIPFSIQNCALAGTQNSIVSEVQKVDKRNSLIKFSKGQEQLTLVPVADTRLDGGSHEMPVLEHCDTLHVENVPENAEMPQLQPVDHSNSYAHQFVTYVENAKLPKLSKKSINTNNGNDHPQEHSSEQLVSTTGILPKKLRQQHTAHEELPLINSESGQSIAPHKRQYGKCNRMKCCKCKTVESKYTLVHVRKHGVPKMQCAWCLYSTCVKDHFVKHYLANHVNSKIYVCVCTFRNGMECTHLAELLLSEEHSYAEGADE